MAAKILLLDIGAQPAPHPRHRAQSIQTLQPVPSIGVLPMEFWGALI